MISAKVLRHCLLSTQSCRNCLVRLCSATTASEDEINKFRKLAASWWDEDGDFKALHSMNRVRIPLITQGLKNTGRLENLYYPHPLKGVSILDVGCGGGILSEPLARLGAQVTGIDAANEGIAVAKAHKGNDLQINYICSTVEKFLEENEDLTFDVVVASEVIEHVDNPELFIGSISKLLKPKGSLVLTTINRTKESWFAAIIIAEYILKLLPRGTHEWKRFVTPQELNQYLSNSGMSIETMQGITYEVSDNYWQWVQRLDINYAIHAVKG